MCVPSNDLFTFLFFVEGIFDGEYLFLMEVKFGKIQVSALISLNINRGEKNVGKLDIIAKINKSLNA